MSDSRPRIGVTGPDRGGAAAWVGAWLAVVLAGGQAVRITPDHPRTIDGLDGLIVGGGADVDPSLYGQDVLADLKADAVPRTRPSEQPRLLYLFDLLLVPLTWLLRKSVGWVAAKGTTGVPHRDARRDAMEMQLIADALARGLPVLGICRGEQLLNVACGGTLHQRLTGLYVEDPEVRTVLARKRIDLVSGTHLARAMTCPNCRPRGGVNRVNALHRQAIDRLGAGLRVAAYDRNGIVQAIERADRPFVVGVQWHPEYLPQRREQRAIFDALVRDARRARARESDDRLLDPRGRRSRLVRNPASSSHLVGASRAR
jgi:putative glutamine amidotransferase